jgi:hypothetical protein
VADPITLDELTGRAERAGVAVLLGIALEEVV